MNKLNIDISLLKKYLFNFYGYGNWKGKIWFIGVEEGGGNSPKEIEKRIRIWNELGKTNLLNLKKHHKKIIPQYFFKNKNEKIILQPTWSKLIRLKLSYENKNISNNEEIRDIQAKKWGIENSDHALIELFPLPSPNRSVWYYSKWTDLEYLKTREKYYEFVSGKRIEFIKNKIKEYKPKIVVLYSASNIKYWNKLVEKDIRKKAERMEIEHSNNRKNIIRTLKEDSTCFIQTPHPIARGISNEFWEKVGQKIREICG